MLAASFVAEEMGLNHILKLCWFTLLEIALRIDESKSACIVGARSQAPVEPGDAEPGRDRSFHAPNSQRERIFMRANTLSETLVVTDASRIELISDD